MGKHITHRFQWFQDIMRFNAQAHVAGPQIFERWNANGYTLHLTASACASAWRTVCVSARDRRFPSIRECISAFKYWLHTYGVNFLLDFISNNCKVCLFKNLFNYIILEKNDKTRWALFLGIASGKHTLHTCNYIWSLAMRIHTIKPPCRCRMLIVTLMSYKTLLKRCKIPSMLNQISDVLAPVLLGE